MPTLDTFIVEDSPIIRVNLIAALEELAAVRVIGSAEDEQSAARWLAENHCDLAIVDILLRGGSGLGVLRAVRQLRHPAKLVVLSNFATPEMRQRCIELGATRVFDKSQDIEALVQYCNELAACDPHAGAGSAGRQA